MTPSAGAPACLPGRGYPGRRHYNAIVPSYTRSRHRASTSAGSSGSCANPAAIAADEVDRFLATYPEFDRVIFCCFGEESHGAYARAVRALDER